MLSSSMGHIVSCCGCSTNLMFPTDIDTDLRNHTAITELLYANNVISISCTFDVVLQELRFRHAYLSTIVCVTVHH